MKAIKTAPLLFIFFCAANKAPACSCDTLTISEAVSSAQVIFIGKIVSSENFIFLFNDSGKVIKVNPSANEIENSLPNEVRAFKKYTFMVDTSLKVDSEKHDKTISILSYWGGPACGYSFKSGERYIVYGEMKAFVDDATIPPYFTSMCTRTTEYEQKEVDNILNYLKKAKN